MPLWKIAWRSIQRRSLASVLTMFSMALGVMLVVAIVLIVGVVDRSFQSNSSLGYDTIVGAKGGTLQLTLNTVYYLSNPVENLPYSFYQEFLPAEARDETPYDGKAGEHFENSLEYEKDGEWLPVEGDVTIPAGSIAVRLRVPLVGVTPADAGETSSEAEKPEANGSSDGLVNDAQQDAELRYEFSLESISDDPSISPANAVAELMSKFSKDDELEIRVNDEWLPVNKELVLPQDLAAVRFRLPYELRRPDGEKRFKLRLNAKSADNLNNVSSTATAILLTKRDEEGKVEGLPELTKRKPDAKIPKTTTLAVNSVSVQPGSQYAVFVARIYKTIDSNVTFRPELIDGYDGEYVQYLAPDKISAIPVCMGDFFGEYRVVGTTKHFFEMVYDVDNDRTYEFAEGHNFTGEGEHGVFEAIIGAKVARGKGLHVGDLIQPSHGAPEGEMHDDFEVVGVLASSGTPQDRAVFVNMTGFNQISMHIRSDGMTEVTSLLVDSKNPMRSREMNHVLSEGKIAQGVKPTLEIYRLFAKFVDPIRNLLLAITLLICIVSGIGILVSIYNSMSDRKQEIAVMRSLGAGKSTVMSIVLLESIMISLVGGLVGWLAGHALIGLASGTIEAETGVVVSALQLAPPMQELSYLLGEQLTPNISVEIWLIPMLIFLAIVVGFLPAWTAYRTDVAEALQSSP